MTERPQKPRTPFWRPLALLALAAALAVFLFLKREPPEKPSETPPPTPAPVVSETTPQIPPAQRDYERLLAADGSPEEDLVVLADYITLVIQSAPQNRRPVLGFNEDLVRALTDSGLLADAAFPKTHPAIRENKLVDRWGTPWQIHPEASDSITLRSAGADRRLYTNDDLVWPKNTPRSNSAD